MVVQESQNSGLQTLVSHSKADDVHDIKKVYGAMSHNSWACNPPESATDGYARLCLNKHLKTLI